MKALIGLLTLGLLLLLVIIIVGVVSSNSELATSASPAPGLPAAAATLALTPTVSNTLIATISTLAPTAIPTSAEVPVGQPYDRFYSQPPIRIKVVRTADPPLVSAETAIISFYARTGTPGVTVSGNKISKDGNSVTFTATYGLVTDGTLCPGSTDKWCGGGGGTLDNCTTDGKCVISSEVIDHVENRLAWVIDVEINPPLRATPTSCNPDPVTCPLRSYVNHTVHVIDAKTLSHLVGTGYYK